VLDRYLVISRGGYRSFGELNAAAERLAEESRRSGSQVKGVCSYVLAEDNERLGTASVYEAPSFEAIDAHFARAGLRIDEIIPIADTRVIARPAPVPHSG
jgi:hypothetical protein